jgi:hypothetical protein
MVVFNVCVHKESSHKVRLCTVSTKETLELVIEIDDKGLSIMSTNLRVIHLLTSHHYI